MSLAHSVFQFTRVSIGVVGAAWLRFVRICKVLTMMFIWWVCSSDPMGVVLWCMHSIWMAWLFTLGSIFNYGRIVGSS